MKATQSEIDEILEKRLSFMGLDQIKFATGQDVAKIKTILLSELGKEGYKATSPTKKPKLRDLEMMNLAREGLTLEEIGKRFSVTRERVRQILKRNGLEGGLAAQIRKKDKLNTLEDFKIKALHLLEEGTTKKNILIKLDIDLNYYKKIRHELIKDGSLPKYHREMSSSHGKISQRQEDILLLRKEGMKNPLIAKYLGISAMTVHREVRKIKLLGIEVPGSRYHWNEGFLGIEREKLYETILAKRSEGKSLRQISNDLEMPYRKIQDRFEEMRILGMITI